MNTQQEPGIIRGDMPQLLTPREQMQARVNIGALAAPPPTRALLHLEPDTRFNAGTLIIQLFTTPQLLRVTFLGEVCNAADTAHMDYTASPQQVNVDLAGAIADGLFVKRERIRVDVIWDGFTPPPATKVAVNVTYNGRQHVYVIPSAGTDDWDLAGSVEILLDPADGVLYELQQTPLGNWSSDGADTYTYPGTWYLCEKTSTIETVTPPADENGEVPPDIMQAFQEWTITRQTNGYFDGEFRFASNKLAQTLAPDIFAHAFRNVFAYDLAEDLTAFVPFGQVSISLEIPTTGHFISMATTFLGELEGWPAQFPYEQNSPYMDQSSGSGGGYTWWTRTIDLEAAYNDGAITDNAEIGVIADWWPLNPASPPAVILRVVHTKDGLILKSSDAVITPGNTAPASTLVHTETIGFAAEQQSLTAWLEPVAEQARPRIGFAASDSSTSIPANTWTALAFATEEDDTHLAFDGTAFVAPKAGIYDVAGAATFLLVTSGNSHSLAVSVNSATDPTRFLGWSRAAVTASHTFSGAVRIALQEGDVIRLLAYCANATTASNTIAGHCSFSAYLVENLPGPTGPAGPTGPSGPTGPALSPAQQMDGTWYVIPK